MSTLEETRPASQDVSAQFLSMDPFAFTDFLRRMRGKPSLSITIDWIDVATARRLKAFLEDFSALGKQARTAAIRATKAQHDQELNVFASGVEWIEVEG